MAQYKGPQFRCKCGKAADFFLRPESLGKQESTDRLQLGKVATCLEHVTDALTSSKAYQPGKLMRLVVSVHRNSNE